MKKWECIEKTTHLNQLVVPGETVDTGDDVELGKHVFKLIESIPDEPGNSGKSNNPENQPDPLAVKTVAELKALADEMKLSYERNIRKDDLIKQINEGGKAATSNPLDALEIDELKYLARDMGINFDEQIEKDELIKLFPPPGEETGADGERKGFLKSIFGN